MTVCERRYEIGVLLALGEKKWKLAGQFLVEILIIATIALGVSGIGGDMVASKMSDQLLQQELAQSQQEAFQPTMFGRRALAQQEQADPIDELDIRITSEDFGKLSLIGLGIAMLSTFIPAMSMMRLPPKTILARQE